MLVGASQDELQTALRLDLATTGLLTSTVILGVGVGVLAGGPLVDRVNRRALFSGATALTGTALLLVGPGAGFGGVALLLCLAGIGGGLYETVLNTAAIEHDEERSVRTVSLMHAGATLGAMLTPLGVSWLLTRADWTSAFRIIGLGHLLLPLLALVLPLGRPGGKRKPGRILKAPLVFLFIAAFAYIGVEAAMMAFAVPYAQEALGLGADRGRSAISLFWLGLLAGRLVFALRAGGHSARPAASAGAAAGLAIAIGVVLAWSRLEVLFALVGFALGGVFPLLVSLAGRRAHATGAGVAIVAGLGSAGGVVVPWVTGIIGDAAGVSTGMLTLALWCGLLVAAALLAESGVQAAERPG